MAVIDDPGALGLTISVEAEDNQDHFAPVGAFLIGVEQADISDQMFIARVSES